MASDAVASEAPTLSDDVLAGNEPALLFHLIHIQQSHPTMVRLIVGSLILKPAFHAEIEIFGLYCQYL